MQWPQVDIESIGNIVAGGLGGAVRWAALRISFREGLIAIFIGGVSALYLSNVGDSVASVALKPFLGENTTANAHLGGFLVGVGGIAVIGFVMTTWRLVSTQMSNNGKSPGELKP